MKKRLLALLLVLVMVLGMLPVMASAADEVLTVTNLALGKDAAQSSTLSGWGADAAVDGNTNTDCYNGGPNKLTHTNQEKEAWWYVDLGSVQEIDAITVYGRTDSTDAVNQRLSDYNVMVVDYMEDTSANAIWCHLHKGPLVESGAGDQENPKGYETYLVEDAENPEEPVKGRYVKIQLTGSNYLSLVEVQVWQGNVVTTADGEYYPMAYVPKVDSTPLKPGYEAYYKCEITGDWYKDAARTEKIEDKDSLIIAPAENDDATINWAPAGTASQSTTGYGGDANKANDGNTNGLFNGSDIKNTTHTNGDQGWWQVDLGAMRNIDAITLWNRTDSTDSILQRLTNFTLSILDDAGEEVWSQTVANGEYLYPMKNFVLDETVKGQVVKLQLNYKGYIHLAEVQVWQNPEDTNDYYNTLYNMEGALIENGSMSVSCAKKMAKAGEEVTITLKPDAYCELTSLTVTGIDGTDIAVEDNKFTMPAQAVKIVPVFEWALDATELTYTNPETTSAYIGNILGTVSLEGGKAMAGDLAIPGTFAWKDPAAVITAEMTTATVVFKPSASCPFDNLEFDMELTPYAESVKDWDDHYAELQMGLVNDRFLAYFHYNMNTFTNTPSYGTGYEDPQCFAPEITGDGDGFNPEQWAEVCKSAGMAGGILTTKHHDGFCLWDSKAIDPRTGAEVIHDIASSKVPDRDFVKEYTDAFREAGLKVGLYFSTWDHRHGIENLPQGDEREYTAMTEELWDFYETQVTELLTNYGKIDYINFDGWQDGGGRSTYISMPFNRVRDLVKQLQPDCLILNHQYEANNAHSEIPFADANGRSGFDGNPYFFSNYNGPAAASDTCSSWFWTPTTKASKTAAQVIAKINAYNIHNATYVLNLPPNREGNIPEDVSKLMAEVGQKWDKPADYVVPLDNWGDCEDPDVNLAHRKDATASSIYGDIHPFQNGRCFPDIALDGTTDGDASGYYRQTARTKSENQPWWQVDLKATYSIDEVEIWGRTDDKTEELNDFTVYILNADKEVVWEEAQTEYPNPNMVIDVPGDIMGRYVKIQRNDTGELALAEVIVREGEIPADYHDVTIGHYDFGLVSTDFTYAAPGETVTLTAKPFPYYRATSLQINGQELVTDDAETVYTFTMPAEDVTVTATFAYSYFDALVPVYHKYKEIDTAPYTTASVAASGINELLEQAAAILDGGDATEGQIKELIEALDGIEKTFEKRVFLFTKVDQSTITATASSDRPGTLGVERVLDGDAKTEWHTAGGVSAPYTLTLEFAQEETISKLELTMRNNLSTGAPRMFDIQVSDDGETFTTVQTVNWTSEVVGAGVVKDVLLDAPVTTKYLRLNITKTDTNAYGSLAEINVYASPYTALLNAIAAAEEKLAVMENAELEAAITAATAMMETATEYDEAAVNGHIATIEGLVDAMADVYAVTYDANGGAGTQEADTALEETAFTLPTETTFTAPEGKTFKGWALTADATDVIATATFTADTTVYAIWEAVDYTITVTAPTNGTVTVAETAAMGEEVTITATPNTDYAVNTITVTGASGDVTVTGGKFTMPAENVTITVTFAANHTCTLVAVAEVPATCTEAGTGAYWKCSCSKMYADAEGKTEITEIPVIAALGHSLVKTDAKAPTYDAKGNHEYWTCSVCGKVFSDKAGTKETTVKEMTIAKVSKPAGGSTGTTTAPSTPETKPEVEINFVDVDDTDWFAKAVSFVVENKLFQGVTATMFAPDANMTRQMTWVVLGRLAGEELNNSTVYADAKAWAMENDISDGTYPSNDVTREQLVTLLWRFVGSPEATFDMAKYQDADEVSAYALPAIQWALAEGVMSGVNANTLDPQGNATRAHVAQIMMNYSK